PAPPGAGLVVFSGPFSARSLPFAPPPLSDDHADAVRGAVVLQRDGPGVHGGAVQLDPRDTPAAVLRVLDLDLVARPPEPPEHRVSGPFGGDAGCDLEGAAAPP